MESKLNVQAAEASSVPPIPAAEYLRKSTEHQKYSVENQSAMNQAYAGTHGMVIVRRYADEGKSGLSIEGRDALKQLIEDVQAGKADFKVILVYDVSRWGRFQDADESGYYEFICKRAGIRVIYCAEQFENDGSPFSAIVKGLKRAMAGEYSRELSVKTFAGQRRIVERGFMMGGPAGFGYRRMLVDPNGAAKGVLEPGEHKSISTDRVILAPGPQEEIDAVRFIFSAFVHEQKMEGQIANALNARGVAKHCDRPWTTNNIRRILRSERYIGTYVWNRTSSKLQQAQVRNNPDAWVRVEGAFQAIIERPLFDAAQAILGKRPKHSITGRPRALSDEEMLGALNRLRKKRGRLSRAIIEGSREVPCAAAYYIRFGGLKLVYQLIGYAQRRHRTGKTRTGRPRARSDREMLEAMRRLLKRHGSLSHSIIDVSPSVPCANSYYARFGSLTRVYQLIRYTPDPNRVRPLRVMRPRDHSDEALLEALRELLRRRGALSRSIIDENKSVPSCGTYVMRFGSLRQAYRRIGYKPYASF